MAAPNPPSFADDFQFLETLPGSCNMIETVESDRSAGYYVNATKDGVTSFFDYTRYDYYEDEAQYDPDDLETWPYPTEHLVSSKLEGEGYTINTITDANLPWKWVTLSGVSEDNGNTIPSGDDAADTAKIAQSKKLAMSMLWNTYAVGGDARYYQDKSEEESAEIGATDSWLIEELDEEGQPTGAFTTYTRDDYYEGESGYVTRDDYYADHPSYNPLDYETYPYQDTETFPFPTSSQIQDETGLLVYEASYLFTDHIFKTSVFSDEGTTIKEQPTYRKCGLSVQNGAQSDFRKPFFAGNAGKFVHVYRDRIYQGIAAAEIQLWNPELSFSGLECGRGTGAQATHCLGGAIFENGSIDSDTLKREYAPVQIYTPEGNAYMYAETTGRSIFAPLHGSCTVNASNLTATGEGTTQQGNGELRSSQATLDTTPSYWEYSPQPDPLI
jgi:hypothetical protein